MGKKNKGNGRYSGEDGFRDRRQTEVSEEELSEYIHAMKPGLAAVIVSLLVLLVAVIVWGFAGTLPVTETVLGLTVDSSDYDLDEKTKKKMFSDEEGLLVVCFADASRFNGQAIREFGDEAVLKMPDQRTFKGKIESRIMVPISREEAKTILFDNEWVLNQCVKQNYNWMLTIRPDEDLGQYAFTLSEVTLLTEEVPPIRFLMK